MPSIKKGEAKPSFAPASADMISLNGRTTNLSENGPLATAWESTGSVDVTHAATTSAEVNGNLGSVARTHAVVESHMMVMTGRRHTIISRNRDRRYRFGS